MSANHDKSLALKNALIQPAVTKWLAEVTPKTFAKYLTPERVVKIVIGAVSRNPILLQCTQQSLIKSVAELVSLGIEPGGPLQQGYLVPRKNKGVWECMPIVSYRGLIALLRRSGAFRSVISNAVYANDVFEVDLASGARPTHKPCMTGDRGELIAVYAIADFADGGTHMDLMTRSDIDRIRSMSPAGNSNFGPWENHYDEMARKSVVRRASKYWPMSSEEWGRVEAIEAREHGDVSFDIIDMPEGLSDADDDAPQALPARSATDNVLEQLQAQQNEAVPVKKQPATGLA